jgi:long-chain acyl-CoA synthetase
MWEDACRADRAFPAGLVRQGGRWEAVGWQEMAQRVERLAAGLVASGVGRGDRVGLLMSTRPEWTICDFALQSVGAVSVPLYATSSRADVAFVLADCEARMLIVESARLKAVEDALAGGAVEPVLVDGGPDGAVTLDVLSARGEERLASDPEVVRTARAGVRSDDVASIIYTSGTTGQPKGCVLTHDNMRTMTDIVAAVPNLLIPGETVLLFLPLAHNFARLMQNLAVKVGITIAYCPDLRSVPAALGEVQPHILPSIPRAYELLDRQIAGQIAGSSPPARAIARWALGTGRRAEGRRQAGARTPLHLRAQLAVADRVVLKRVRERVGGRLRLAVAGGAPLALHVAESLAGAGIRVMEGYGLSEATCASHFNRPQPGLYRFGTVGRALPGVDVRLDDEGEVQIHGPTVFAGYYRDPAATRDVMTEDGWLKTGDLGDVDADGFLRITGRKKDLIVTSGGENVAPLPIEEALMADPLVSQVLVVGDARPYLVALLTVDPSEKRRRRLDDDDARSAVGEVVARVNRSLGSAERIRRHAVLDREFSQEAGEVTPTLKLRRTVCVEHNRDRLSELYGQADP